MQSQTPGGFLGVLGTDEVGPMIDVSLDVGYKGAVMEDAKSSVMLSKDGWDLIKINWEFEDDTENIIWASHVKCTDYYQKNWREARGSKHFPRDNALFGKCCYCSDPCPEEMQVLFKMYNWQFIPHWGQRPSQ